MEVPLMEQTKAYISMPALEKIYNGSNNGMKKNTS